jgi:hypothetical protein
MNGNPHYAAEKLNEAVAILATDRHAIRMRLLAAAPLVFAAAEHVPASLQPYYDALVKGLTRLRPDRRRRIGALGATVSRIRLATCESMATRIVELAERLGNNFADGRAARTGTLDPSGSKAK